MSIRELVADWRDRAAFIRSFVRDERAAQLWADAASELEAVLRLEDEELLSPVQAEREGLGDAETIAKAGREGRLTNHGKKNRPKFRRSDIQKRVRSRVARDTDGVPSISALAIESLQLRSRNAS